MCVYVNMLRYIVTMTLHYTTVFHLTHHTHINMHILHVIPAHFTRHTLLIIYTLYIYVHTYNVCIMYICTYIQAIQRLLENRKSPSRRVNELDNRASNFYIGNLRVTELNNINMYIRLYILCDVVFYYLY